MNTFYAKILKLNTVLMLKLELEKIELTTPLLDTIAKGHIYLTRPHTQGTRRDAA